MQLLEVASQGLDDPKSIFVLLTSEGLPYMEIRKYRLSSNRTRTDPCGSLIKVMVLLSPSPRVTRNVRLFTRFLIKLDIFCMVLLHFAT